MTLNNDDPLCPAGAAHACPGYGGRGTDRATMAPGMMQLIREQRLGFVATVNADGTPNLSPKNTFAVVDAATVAFGEIRSSVAPVPHDAARHARQRMTKEHDMIDRRAVCAAMLAAAIAPIASIARTAEPVRARNVVLVHGLFADGSSWSEVIPLLQAAGLNAVSVQNPLTTLQEAVAETDRVIARQDGPTVLVGHSFSGMIVSQAGANAKVTALVYVAARAPDAGEDYSALAKRFPTPPASAGIVFDGDEGRLTEEAFLRDFAGDVPAARARALYAVQWPFHKALMAGRTTVAAWRSKPSYYAVSTEDRTIDPELQRFMAKRMNAHTIELKSSHVSLISHPREISDLIIKATGASG